jgi:hypothetical protein
MGWSEQLEKAAEDECLFIAGRRSGLADAARAVRAVTGALNRMA